MVQLYYLAHHIVVDVKRKAMEQSHILCYEVVDVIDGLPGSITLVFRKVSIIQPVTLYECQLSLQAGDAIGTATDKVIHSLGVEVVFSIGLYADVALISALKAFL